MVSVKAYYQHRVDGPELVNHEKEVKLHRELCDIIDNYPWVRESELFEELGEGGGFFFILGDEDSKYATYQFTPMGYDEGLLDLDIVVKPGFLNIFNRKAVSKSFDVVSIPEAKRHLKEFFDHSVDSLYKKYKR
ncbi:hypothetical protein MHO82_13330 [Vibrio sp. Of7-15]|uniref:hypothetical protein n=1 Tax=Vibrio sp. Of7-15 TaxID=2724879 RepID=UPI001EF330E4|nr:hypothetical protein [Vibrio sp. Of7-15]MCG7497846.1 hypothetical protein [Vibrio sp. Of7-15]